jgi:hypothetical protein
MRGNVPRPRTGTWLGPPGPEWAVLPLNRIIGDTFVNPCLDTNDIRRVIDHTTIVMDDKYCFDADPDSPPSCEWVRRPGYSDSCWAAPGTYQQMGDTWYAMSWRPRLGCSGLWRFEVYKTPRYGNDVLNDSVFVLGIAEDSSGPTGTYYNESVGPYNVWQPVGDTLWLSAGPYASVYIENTLAHAHSTLTYYDAFRAEYVGPSGDGGASSAAVVLGDETQFVRVMPNPVGRTARISYTVRNGGPVVIAVYDVTGRVVLRAAQGIQHAGAQNATISVAGLPTGAYMARVSAASAHATCRFVVCR